MNISPQTVAALQGKGWDIIRVSDVLPATTSDLEILEFARQENRVVITQDLDFSMLLALGGYNQPSLVTLRLSLTDPDIITKRLMNTIPQVEQILIESPLNPLSAIWRGVGGEVTPDKSAIFYLVLRQNYAT
ncbi:MAG: DUF5615 family PIN-like protein [Nostoc sp.]